MSGHPIATFTHEAHPLDPIVARILFTDGVWRDVHEPPTGKQYVIDGNGIRLFGVWYIPRDEFPQPNVVLGADDDF